MKTADLMRRKGLHHCLVCEHQNKHQYTTIAASSGYYTIVTTQYTTVAAQDTIVTSQYTTVAAQDTIVTPQYTTTAGQDTIVTPTVAAQRNSLIGVRSSQCLQCHGPPGAHGSPLSHSDPETNTHATGYDDHSLSFNKHSE